jgi:F420-0:gamma-glutamyl ligase-like protein
MLSPGPARAWYDLTSVEAVQLVPNEGKAQSIEVDGIEWARLPIRTHTVMAADDLTEVVTRYAGPHLQPGDVIFLSERMVAITQGRAIPIDDIRPTKLANFLVRFVHKSPYGIGIGSPWTMELAIREVGVPRMLLGAFVAGATKPLGVRGMFYRVVGPKVRSIDGPCDNTLPPYNTYATLGPAAPRKVARALSKTLGHEVVIIDANDLGVNVLGVSSRMIREDWATAVFRDNPLGQSDQRTPICLVRRAVDV